MRQKDGNDHDLECLSVSLFFDSTLRSLAREQHSLCGGQNLHFRGFASEYFIPLGTDKLAKCLFLHWIYLVSLIRGALPNGDGACSKVKTMQARLERNYSMV